MRSYLPVTADEIQTFLASGKLECGPLYAPTIKFLVTHSEMDEEEGEFFLSMLAADEAMGMRIDLSKPGLILSLEIEESQIAEHGENFILLKELAQWSSVQCAFEVSADDELTWFATQEIASKLLVWLQN